MIKYLFMDISIINKKKSISISQIITLVFFYIVSSYLPNYKGINIRLVISMGWLILLAIYYFEIQKLMMKEKSIVRQQMTTLAFLFGVVFITIQLISGMLLGFGKNPASITISGILYNSFCVGTVLVGREVIRTYTLCSFKRKKMIKVLIFIIMLFTLTDLSINRILAVKSSKDVVIVLAQYILPILCKNIFATFLVLYGGAKASIIYLGMLLAFEWLSPILPLLPWLGVALIGVVIPLLGTSVVVEKHHKLTKFIKGIETKKESILSYVVPSIIIVATIWFMVGVFPYYPSAIVTGSMKPMIQPGDVVIINKIESLEAMKELEVGDIIQFERNDLMINHRIIEIIERDGQTLYQTKGDNNNVADTPLVEMKDIRGRIIKVVPKVGWPSVWLHTGGGKY